MSFSSRPKKARAPLNEAGLYEYAVKALGRRMRTEVELRRLMHRRVEPGEAGAAVVAAVVMRLKEYGYLDDKSYAETFTRLRQENEKLGQRTVRQKLQQKGVAARIVEETIEARYAGTDEEALARQYLERKRIRKPEDEKATARVMRRLVAAGFATDVIYRILRQWDVPDEALSQLDNLGESAQDTGSE
ncbi:regulatory protein RecX [Occallatibacter riparius]|uniref:Regulatory protein RecX n=1 Tax=Occallatibacter riparius TaxID=1002689 RepID=A0A9J7BX17_9BACT|nr:regulatory protein RecX [Occallatibacter riparius]UWZ85613.1 recombination regulator RecX [Occallatibacter riparius]